MAKARTAVDEEELFSTGETWDFSLPE